eukprot:1200546-Rhodomonas_salina.1
MTHVDADGSRAFPPRGHVSASGGHGRNVTATCGSRAGHEHLRALRTQQRAFQARVTRTQRRRALSVTRTPQSPARRPWLSPTRGHTKRSQGAVWRAGGS